VAALATDSAGNAWHSATDGPEHSVLLLRLIAARWWAEQNCCGSPALQAVITRPNRSP